MRQLPFLCFVLSLLITAGDRARADSPARPATVDFARDIRPILSDKCFRCHGPDDGNREGGFRLDKMDRALQPAESGAIPVVSGDPDESELFRRITSTDEDLQMPPPSTGKSLSVEEIDAIRHWIAEGAQWQMHWSFQTPERHDLPPVQQSDWPANGIDWFVLAELERQRLSPSPPADRTTLIRRVTLDLTGLPPTPAEVDAFLNDTSDEAYERLVDRLLQSPRYGEHMGRYWLDAVRYADTHGLHLDNYREMWPFRDWVINAFNNNMPFDQFTVEQIAGDLLPEATLLQQVASGYNRCHISTSEGGSIAEEVYVRNVVDRVTTTTTVWMGMTSRCAVCHDHKFDPLTQREFYELFAFFNSMDGDPLDKNRKDPPPVVFVPLEEDREEFRRLESELVALQAQLDAVIADADAAQVEWEAKLRTGDANVDDELGKTDNAELRDRVKSALVVTADKRDDEQKDQVATFFRRYVFAATKSLLVQIEPLQTAQDSIRKRGATTLVMKETSEPRPAFRLHRGDYDQRRDQVERNTPSALPPMKEGMPHDRLGFAQWLLDAEHPLTARVAVNRFWQQYFGTGIVLTSEDFGAQGDPPSHPDLLDWLSVEFREGGWDIKRLQKLIVTSATYRQHGGVDQELLQRDPHNRLLARGPRFRMDAEQLRDQALAVSGLLVNELGGASVKPPQPAGLWKAVGYSGSNTVNFTADSGDKIYRRSLYTFWKRTAPPPQMTIGDAPSRETCTMRRERTNTPLLALMLLNERQFFEAARQLASIMIRDGGDSPEQRAALGFRRAAAREPHPEELSELVSLFADSLGMFQQDPSAAMELIQQGDSPHSDEFDAPELAAWTIVSNTILNLDEVVNKE